MGTIRWPAMDVLSLRDRWSARLNPMFVRCLRQELRSKGFMTAYLLLLLGGTIVSLFMAHLASDAALSETSDAGRHGRWLFNILAWAWGFILIVWQAGATNRAVLQERQDDTWDLVELTGLGPRRLVHGLLLTSIVQGAVYTAGLAPFLAMAYLLRGLDLVAVLEAFLLVPMAGAVASAWAVLIAAGSPARRPRGLAGGLVILLLLVPWFALSGPLFSGMGGSSLLGTLAGKGWEGLITGLLILHAWALLLWLPLVLAESLLSHRADDRSSRPRLAAAVAAGSCIVWAGIGAGVGLFLTQRNWWEPFVIAAIPLATLAVITGFFAGTEDEALTVRQARALANRPRWIRGLFGPGDRRGLRLAALLGALALAMAGIATLGHNGSRVFDLLRGCWFALVYAAALFLIGDRLLRGPLAPWITTPGQRRGGLLAVVAVATLLPLIGTILPGSTLTEVSQLLSPPVAIARLAGDDAWDGFRTVVTSLAVPILVWFVARLWPRAAITRQVVADGTTEHPRG